MEDAANNKTANIVIAFVNIILYFIMVTVNALANILPINGKNTGELSAQYPNLFVPAGFTFAIWGVIYLLLLLYTGYHLFSALTGRKKIKQGLPGGIAFGVTCILNSLWIFAWHYELIFLSVLIMLALLLTLIYLFIRTDRQATNGMIQAIALKLPVNVYLGWISVATIANITVLLVYLKWDGWGVAQNIWAIIAVAVGTALAVLMLIQRKNIAFSVVIIWAYMGIIIKRLSDDIVYNDIIFACCLAMAIIIILIFITAVGEIKKTKNKKADFS